jgi:MFS transporter, DHA1 family, multidrug resistance protein
MRSWPWRRRSLTNGDLTSGQTTTSASVLPKAVQWTRNLAALWAAVFIAIAGFSFPFPFIPIYLHGDLAVHDQHSLAVWSGVAAGAGGFSMAIASPVWGLVADRFGRRQMVIRAMLGGAISVGLMSLAQNPLQLTAIRFLQGATAGTVASSSALVVSQTPRHHVAKALGLLGSAIALGNAAGPLLAGLFANVFGLRSMFFAGGVLLSLSVLPVLFVVRESRGSNQTRALSARESLGTAQPGTGSALAVLIVGQGLMQITYTAFLQLSVVRLIAINPSKASLATGIAFGVSGLAMAGASITYWRLVRFRGYKPVATISAVLMASTVAIAAAAPSLPLLVVTIILFGMVFGVLTPLLTSMIGLESPAAIAATVYGISASAIALGFGIGAVLGGTLAGLFGIGGGYALAIGAAIALATAVAFLAREPSPDLRNSVRT